MITFPLQTDSILDLAIGGRSSPSPSPIAGSPKPYIKPKSPSTGAIKKQGVKALKSPYFQRDIHDFISPQRAHSIPELLYSQPFTSTPKTPKSHPSHQPVSPNTSPITPLKPLHSSAQLLTPETGRHHGVFLLPLLFPSLLNLE